MLERETNVIMMVPVEKKRQKLYYSLISNRFDQEHALSLMTSKHIIPSLPLFIDHNYNFVDMGDPTVYKRY